MGTLRDRLLSEENIFLSIYLADSWMLNPELLEESDYRDFLALKDIYDEENIAEVISQVKARIFEVLDKENVFFTTRVFFKPKGQKEGSTVFRPIHTARLIDQIAMIAMLQVLVYEIGTDGKFIPSELSKMIPSHFYGNRVSYDGKSLFKPWKEQYHEYTEKANEKLIEFSHSGEQRYEINLDLENFFPSIDPQVLFQYIHAQFPQKWKGDDRATAETILRKLMLFELEGLNKQEWNWYCGNPEKKVPEKRFFAKGQPQGLPHTYFIANLFMLMIQEEYQKVFPGEMLFYVDDSVIFTNGTDTGQLDKEIVQSKISQLNQNIRNVEGRLRKEDGDGFLPDDYPYHAEDFGVTVHDLDGKSMFSNVEEANQNSGELYLRGLSRETSNISFHLFSMFSEEDASAMLSRTKSINEVIRKELERTPEGDVGTAVRRKKLLRYKKFFSYRETLLHYRCQGNLDGLMEDVLQSISLRADDKSLELFWEKYNDDILAASIDFLLKRCQDDGKDTTKLVESIRALCSTLYGRSVKHAYLLKTYGPYMENKEEHYDVDIYQTLRRKMDYCYCGLRKQTYKRKIGHFHDLLSDGNNDVFVQFGFKKLKKWGKYVRGNSYELERGILNAAFASLFYYDVDDRFIFSKRSREPIKYTELRTLAALKSKDFSYRRFVGDYKHFIDDAYQCTVDYSLLQVMEIFHTFVREGPRIDQLICIHKYCCDTWKNGSKHLHFYTLHNQEHAVILIKQSVRWLHALSLFNLKQSDYFLLFAACYLHDISMVTIPDYDRFYTGTDTRANQILTSVETAFRKGGTTKLQKALLNAYQEMDAYFEEMVRSSHAGDSAKEIRKFKELDFIEPSTREFIARISEAHGYDTTDIYGAKAMGKSELINEKQIKILLRLSDLLDMSRYRVSDVILKHNLSKLGEVSRFHWISHLITDGCTLTTEYHPTEEQPTEEKETLLKNGCITEKLILTVNVLMSQTTPIHNHAACHGIQQSELVNGPEGQPWIRLVCDGTENCVEKTCSFLCKWFTLKNDYLLKEFSQLKQYLSSLPDLFFRPEIEIHVKVIADQEIPNDIFDYLRDFVSGHQ